nr:DUF2513 domain-containing protein [Pinisolibacter aquiterrae]
MDYVRELLLDIEGKERPGLKDLLPVNAGNAEYLKLAEHLRMLVDEAGFVSGIPAHNLAGKNWLDLRLTWQGHDFLNSVRDPETWVKTKKGALAAGGWTVDILKDLAKGFIKKQLEEHTGIKL